MGKLVDEQRYTAPAVLTQGKTKRFLRYIRNHPKNTNKIRTFLQCGYKLFTKCV